MKDKDISVTEYATTLGCAAVVAILFVLALLSGGAYAITKLFDLQWWQGVALFLFCVALWYRPKAG